jgi:hypothetical protein
MIAIVVALVLTLNTYQDKFCQVINFWHYNLFSSYNLIEVFVGYLFNVFYMHLCMFTVQNAA